MTESWCYNCCAVCFCAAYGTVCNLVFRTWCCAGSSNFVFNYNLTVGMTESCNFICYIAVTTSGTSICCIACCCTGRSSYNCYIIMFKRSRCDGCAANFFTTYGTVNNFIVSAARKTGSCNLVFDYNIAVGMTESCNFICHIAVTASGTGICCIACCCASGCGYNCLIWVTSCCADNNGFAAEFFVTYSTVNNIIVRTVG